MTEAHFTGADRTQKGWCELADGGTLFLDEIGEMELNLQPKLLRFLQEQTVQRVGGGISQRVNVRILAATNQDPAEMVLSGQLREDLYYRLNVFPIDVPSLRQRREDIAMIATAILERTVAKNGTASCFLSPEILEILAQNDWPGNVRQLENVVQRLVIVSKGGEIGPELLPPELLKSVPRPIAVQAMPHNDTLTVFEHVEKRAIEDALRKSGGNAVKAAEQLGLGQATIYRKIRQYGIARKTFGSAKIRGDANGVRSESDTATDAER